MAYITQSDVEAFAGFSFSDFRNEGRAMTSAEFETFIETCIEYVSQLIHRYCNVVSFETHSVTEYHNGRGATDDERASAQYTEQDRVFYLRDNPVISLTKVEVDVNPITSTPSWSQMSLRSDQTAGHFIFVNDNEHAFVRFHNNVPKKGIRNVRVTYSAGYAADSDQFKELQLVALRMTTNLLLLKKKYQEATTIRNANVRDYAQMFDVFNESDILTTSVATQLERYRRITIPTSAGYL